VYVITSFCDHPIFCTNITINTAQLISPAAHMRGASDRAAERYSPSLERAPGSLMGSSQNYSARSATQNRKAYTCMYIAIGLRATAFVLAIEKVLYYEHDD